MLHEQRRPYVLSDDFSRHLASLRIQLAPRFVRSEFSTHLASLVAALAAKTDRSSQPPVFHRDLKSLNVLITSKFRGKVSDFGMAKDDTSEIMSSSHNSSLKSASGGGEEC